MNNVDEVLLISKSRYVRSTGRGRGWCDVHGYYICNIVQAY